MFIIFIRFFYLQIYEHQKYGDTVKGAIDPEMLVQAVGRIDLDELTK